jgi:hypothetical protein
MHCYHHQDREAVGGCKSCGKGLCPECAADLGKGLACRGRCEADVLAVIALVDRNIKLTPTTSRILESARSSRSNAATFNLAIGAIFIAWGLQDAGRFSFVMVLGVCFLAFGGYGFLQARRFARERPQP